MFSKKTLFLVFMLAIVATLQLGADQHAQFRGPNRDGVFPESGLLKQWPEDGPVVLWLKDDLDAGYASVAVSDEMIFLTGRHEGDEYLIVLDLQGKLLWRLKYGKGVRGSFPESRCTPTVDGDKIFLISGAGEVVCVGLKQKKVLWSVPGFELFEGEAWKWEVAESPLIVDDKVIYTPGGQRTSLVALNRNSGETVWESESLGVPSALVSPILVEYGGKKIIVSIITDFVFGVDAKSGKLLWKVKYVDLETPNEEEWWRRNNCVTPLYHDGQIFVTSGYDHVAVMFRMIDGGEGIEQVWINKDLDNHHGQVVRIGSHIYGSNWIDNRHGNWCCVDWKTGETLYETTWHNKGPISAADGMLYCYDEKGGNLGLVKVDPTKFEVTSSFEVTQGSGPHWSQPVIKNGVLYIRHGAALLAYDVKLAVASDSRLPAP